MPAGFEKCQIVSTKFRRAIQWFASRHFRVSPKQWFLGRNPPVWQWHLDTLGRGRMPPFFLSARSCHGLVAPCGDPPFHPAARHTPRYGLGTRCRARGRLRCLGVQRSVSWFCVVAAENENRADYSCLRGYEEGAVAAICNKDGWPPEVCSFVVSWPPCHL